MVRRTLSDEDGDAIRHAARRQDVLAAMTAFYADLEAAVAEHQPRCILRGACCRFDEYGHNLFVTTLEAAWFIAHMTPSPAAPAGAQSTAVMPDGCPYQVNGRCTVREARPMGCRIFFCDPQSRHWQGPLTEESLARLRALHDRFAVSYIYAEWRNVLRSLGL